MTLAVAFRPATEADIGFVMRSFVESWSQSEQALDARKDLGLSRAGIMDAAHAMLTGLLDRGYLATLAVDPVDPDVIYGYAIHRGDVCAWVYVRNAARRQGVAAALMERCGFAPRRTMTAVFIRIQPVALARSKGWIVRTNPFIAMVTK